MFGHAVVYLGVVEPQLRTVLHISMIVPHLSGGKEAYMMRSAVVTSIGNILSNVLCNSDARANATKTNGYDDEQEPDKRKGQARSRGRLGMPAVRASGSWPLHISGRDGAAAVRLLLRPRHTTRACRARGSA